MSKREKKLIEVRGLKKYFEVKDGVFTKKILRAVYSFF